MTQRLAARAIDIVVWAVVDLVAQLLAGQVIPQGLAGAVYIWLGEPLVETFTGGTPGMLACGIAIRRRVNLHRAGFLRLLWRQFVIILSLIPIVLLFSLLMYAAARPRQFLHDNTSGTNVYSQRKANNPHLGPAGGNA